MIGSNLKEKPVIAIVGEKHVACQHNVFVVSNGIQEAFIKREELNDQLIRQLAHKWQFEFQEHKIG